VTVGLREGAERVRVVIYGFGRVGRAVLELAVARPWIEVAAVIARTPGRDGEPCVDSVPDAPGDLRVTTDAVGALREARPDVVIVATTSRLADVLPQLEAAAASGTRAVISTAEELAWARPDDSPQARAVHELATRHGTAILATGVNPGFVLDLLPLVLSGLAWDVERIEARRVVDVSVFAPHTRRQLGIGHTPEAFAAGVAAGSIVGHLGFRESLRLLSEGMGRPADAITIDTDPVVAEHAYRLADGSVEPGTTIGATQRAVAWREGAPWISVEMLLHAAPTDAGVRPIDEVHLFGRHEVHATIDPGTGAVLGTAAQLVNIIPAALAAEPGWYGPGQLPPHGPWLGAGAPVPHHRATAAVA
jgi:4-hydroxy-tetrahydrodipicolinate reductase